MFWEIDPRHRSFVTNRTERERRHSVLQLWHDSVVLFYLFTCDSASLCSTSQCWILDPLTLSSPFLKIFVLLIYETIRLLFVTKHTNTYKLQAGETCETETWGLQSETQVEARNPLKESLGRHTKSAYIKLAFKVSCLMIQNRLSFSEDKRMISPQLLTGIQIMLATKIK